MSFRVSKKAVAVSAVGVGALALWSSQDRGPARSPPFPSPTPRHGKENNNKHLSPIPCLDGTQVIPWAAPSRAWHKEQLKTQDFDVLVIGGGATGAGCALDAAARGLKVALVERDDFAGGTSSRSTKLIHGGIRYLEQAFKTLDLGMFDLVQEALEERSHMLHAAPFMAKPLPIMIPLYAAWEVPYLWAGCKLYDLVAKNSNYGRVPPSFFINKQEALFRFPMLKSEGLKGAMIYYDGQMNDSRMNVALTLTAAQFGANTLNYTELVRFIKESPPSNPQQTTKPGGGKIVGAVVKDTMTGEEISVKCRAVINATGVFSDAVRKLDDPTCPSLIEPAAGVHIVLPDHFCPEETGLIIPKTSDGRVLFFLPWEGATLAGTTDAASAITMTPEATQQEVGFILKESSHYLNKKITKNDVVAAWAGIRPLVKDPESVKKAQAAGQHISTAKLSRSHAVDVSNSGLVSILGGKWTTYRKMAEDAVDKVVNDPSMTLSVDKAEIGSSPTKFMQLVGADRVGIVCGHKFDKISVTLRNIYGLEKSKAESLVHNYGTRALQIAELARTDPRLKKRLHPKYPFIRAEVLFAMDQEYAVTCVDVLARRTRLAFLDAEAAISALPVVLQLMAERGGWDRKRRQEEEDRARKFFATMSAKK